MAKTRTSLRKVKVPVSPYARAIRLRLYPTPTQERVLRRYTGAARHIWNWGLAECKAALAARERVPSSEDLCNRLTAQKALPERAWLSEIPTDVLQQTLRDLGLAITAWRKKLRRFPRRRKRSAQTGIRFVITDRRERGERKGPNPKIDIHGRHITLTRVGAVRWRGSRDRLPTGDIAMATVRREGGLWFLTLPERDTAAPTVRRPIHATVGIDLGVRDAMVTSTGGKQRSSKPLAQARARLRRYQRRYARQRAAAMRRAGMDPNVPIPKGTRFVRPGSRIRPTAPGRKVVMLSSRALRTQATIARLHGKVTAQRQEFQHQATRRLIDSAAVICLEDLAVARMARALRKAFRRSVADVGLGELRRQLTYKAAWAGRTLSVVDRWYPSTQLCSAPGCSYRNTSLTLRDRAWTCPQCGITHDRDVNAAKNIEREGLRLLGHTSTARSGVECSPGEQSVAAGIDARGEAASSDVRKLAWLPTSTNREPSYRGAKRRPRVKAEHDVRPQTREV